MCLFLFHTKHKLKQKFIIFEVNKTLFKLIGEISIDNQL